LDRLRDIEIYNELRKELACIFNRIINGVTKDRLDPEQQAFVSRRDILINNDPSTTILLLLLDYITGIYLTISRMCSFTNVSETYHSIQESDDL